jgi:hypothetical protein
MANAGFNERQSNLQGPNVKKAQAAQASGISGLIQYKFYPLEKWNLFSQFLFPMLASQGTIISGGMGAEYIFGQTSSALKLEDKTTHMLLRPISRFSAFGAINLSYLAYETPTAKKQDTILDIEAGAAYRRKISKFNLKTQASVARGIGVATEGMFMKFFIGGTFFLD